MSFVMIRSKLLYISAVFVLILSSCVKRYEPEIKKTDVEKYVVTGQVIMGDPVQVVNICLSSPITKPEIRPVIGCQVTIIDSKGNSYIAKDVWGGNYEAVIPLSAIVPGNSFKVDIVTSGGVHITSDFDQIQDCPPVDSVYYVVQHRPTSSPIEFDDGIQFYVNLDAENYSCRYYKWEATETWEYHTQYPIEFYYDGMIHMKQPPDSSKMVCWKSMKIRDLYTVSTKELAHNKYNKYPLHFVDNLSSARLVYGYSLLLRQFALSENAYNYWDKIRINSQEQGGLYESQPLSVKGNLHNITDPGQDVLGFFGAASVREKRIFVRNVPDLTSEFVFNCVFGDLKWGLAGASPSMYPIYLPTRLIYFYDPDTTVRFYTLLSIDHECVDCTSTVGGKNVKPDFWPY
jgi:hypothetical protein